MWVQIDSREALFPEALKRKNPKQGFGLHYFEKAEI